MDEYIREVTSDFRHIATSTGFRFNQYSGSVDWENLDKFVANTVVEKSDVNCLSMLVASVLSYNIDKMSVSKKIFRLSQLIIDFLLHCKKHSTFKFNDKMDSMELCELCGKMFINVNYLNNCCFQRHKIKSCTFENSPENEYNKSLKSENTHLKPQLIERNSTIYNEVQNFEINHKEQNINNCNAVHKNKLLFHLIPQPGDNPMQTQELFWKQKYDSLEENYNNIKIKYEKNKNTIKTTNVLHNKYQQCDLNNIQKYSKYVQTQSLIENSTSPKRPSRKIDVMYNTNNDISDKNNVNSIHHGYNVDVSLDRDFHELTKLKQEAHMNIIENNICEDYSELLWSSDYVDSIKFVLKLEQGQVNELFKNVQLMDLITFDIKELVNKRLEEYYLVLNKNDEPDNILYSKNSNKNQENSEISIGEDNNIELHSSSKIDCDKIPVKKNKTIMSKLKKKALRLSKVFSPDSKNIEDEFITKKDTDCCPSNDKINNDNGNIIHSSIVPSSVVSQ